MLSEQKRNTARPWSDFYRKGDLILLQVITLFLRDFAEGEEQEGWADGGRRYWVDAVTKKRPKVGSVFFKPDALEFGLHLSARYHAPARPPIIIVLPSSGGPADQGQWWCVDEISSDDIWKKETNPTYVGLGWHVTGPIDRLHCSPSIRTGNYHANVEHGILVPYSDSKV